LLPKFLGESLPVKQEILVHTFANGLTLLAEPIAALESAAFSILTPAGCAYDPDNRNGLAAVTCELTLRGAGDRDSRQLVQDLDNLGVERGESVSPAHTSYSGATLAKNLEPALEIFADVVRRPRLPDDQLDPVRNVVLQELQAIEDEPSQKTMQELRRRQYPDAWGRSSHGERAHLQSITKSDVKKFHSAQYQPRGMIIGVAGRFDWARLRDRVGELFGDWAVANNQPEPAAIPRVPQAAHLDHESNQTQIGIAYDTIPYRHDDYFEAWAGVGVLSGGMSSRLFTEVREKRGLCYTVYASYHTLRDRGAVLCYAGTTAERAQETLDVTLGELTRLAAGIVPNELDRLKARIKSGLIMQQESSSSRSGAIARDWYHLGRVRTLTEISERVDRLTCESINRYLANHPPRDFTIVTLGQKALSV
jgi:predicted Zn-dependent peptidase